MSDEDHWLNEARRTLDAEALAVRAARERLGREELGQSVRLLKDCTGRVVVTGMGKSGAIGRKFTGTLASTGTPALYLHPSEALHGDLGMIVPGDVLVAFSYSGETDELLAILPAIVRLGVPIIALTGRPSSTLGRASRVVIDVCVDQEACPMNLAPTTSTTVMLAVSDAIAMAVMMARNFTQTDYAALHPAGTLGRKLLLRVSDVMRMGDALAVVREDASLHEALFAITKAHAGAAIVTNEANVVTGIVTDGDARRILLRDLAFWDRPVRESMNTKFGTVPPDLLATESLALLESFHPDPGVQVGEAPVTDVSGHPLGMLMLKDLVKAGIA